MVLETKPDLVHAMRIPFEGIMAAEALASSNIPLLLSVWGNDFTLHAAQSRLVSALTRKALLRADGLHPDCRRDLALAHKFGFSRMKPFAVLPGSGGVCTATFSADAGQSAELNHWLPPHPGEKLVVNARGFRDYVRNDTFFASLPAVLSEHPDATVVCVGMADHPVALQAVRRLGIEGRVRLLPKLSQPALAALFARSTVVVSPTEHDGTPNTLLEAIACGSFPIAGDIDSVREWITYGVNGYLVDPTSPDSIAAAVVRALADPTVRQGARTHNNGLVAQRASRTSVAREIERLYAKTLERRGE